MKNELQNNLRENIVLDRDHTLVKSFFNSSSLVESNLASFNDFLDAKMQEVVQDVNSMIYDEDLEIKLG